MFAIADRGGGGGREGKGSETALPEIMGYDIMIS